MSITTKHNDFEIQYDESGNEWTCSQLQLRASSLAALRVKINKIDADSRRLSVPVIVVSRYGTSVANFGTATLLDGDDVWVMSEWNGKSRRQKEPLRLVKRDTPEARALIADVEAVEKLLCDQRNANGERLKQLVGLDASDLLKEDASGPVG